MDPLPLKIVLYYKKLISDNKNMFQRPTTKSEENKIERGGVTMIMHPNK